MDPFEILVEAHRPAMKAVLAKLVDLFRAHDVRYVIGGANALSLYVRPRMTVDVDAFVDAARKEEMDRFSPASSSRRTWGSISSTRARPRRISRSPMRATP